MVIPQSVSFFGHAFPFIWVFVISGLLTYLFVFWYEGKREGFAEKRLFNLAFICIILPLSVMYVLKGFYSWLSIFVYKSVFLRLDETYFVSVGAYLVSLITLILFSRLTKWSIYRLLDIYAQAVLVFWSFYLIGLVILNSSHKLGVPGMLAVLLSVVFPRLKGYKMVSGMVFALTNLLAAVSALVVYPKQGYLIITVLLVTIALVVIYVRQKGAPMSYQLPSDLLEQLKNRLLKRAKDLKKGDDLLKQEDAYAPSRRDAPSTENIDSAILEDYQKELTDKNRDLLKKARSQISKALLFMTAGKYGVCELCGRPIDKARLKIYPEATRCIDCAAKSE